MAAESPVDIERALWRIVVGYRGVAAVWLVLLGIIALAGTRKPERPWVVVATMVGIGIWTTATVWFHGRRPMVLRTWWWLTADVAVSIWTLFSGDVAATEASFYGGYPMSSVFMGVAAFGMVGAMSAAVALSVATIGRILRVSAVEVSRDSGSVLIYLFAGFLTGWAIGVLRRNDRLRRQAEQELVEERASRARAEERAEVAAHLHDSVLQTLAMIQRTDRNDEARVIARRQERELRAWLFGDEAVRDATFASEMRAMCAEAEDRYRVRVQVVVVGDRELDAPAEAAVNAAREAVANAARHAGVGEISVYAEAGEGSMTAFIRDRGRGFHPEQIPADRKGIAESIRGRMSRHGGTAAIRSEPGHGTEVVLKWQA